MGSHTSLRTAHFMGCSKSLGFNPRYWQEILSSRHFDDGMSLERVHLEVLRFLFDNLPQDESEIGEVSRKILFKSVNFKPRQIEKACKELEVRNMVRFKFGFYKNEWSSISITDDGIDYVDTLF